MNGAKNRDLPNTAGLGQAKKYAEKWETRFTYSRNGIGIYQVDTHTWAEGYINQHPTPINCGKPLLAKITSGVIASSQTGTGDRYRASSQLLTND